MDAGRFSDKNLIQVNLKDSDDVIIARMCDFGTVGCTSLLGNQILAAGLAANTYQV